MKLPIEIVQSKNPPVFRWWSYAPIPGGRRLVNHEGTMPTHVEQAIMDLIALCKGQQEEIASLKRQIEGHVQRIAAQSEIISKKAEKPAPQPTPNQPAQHPSTKKGK